MEVLQFEPLWLRINGGRGDGKGFPRHPVIAVIGFHENKQDGCLFSVLCCVEGRASEVRGSQFLLSITSMFADEVVDAQA